ncbi:hypothetical protein QTO34_004340 [Cnephaeus nilssonii]|uniref:S-phase kinase-associated protein 1 n=1 Tax=Cnephaeus nilssonii TaxID=3371016 RepID=A0AA40HP11_CNENI|nr:hypothetical protein QTO34_004340 [Eptesicus nilssonii]
MRQHFLRTYYVLVSRLIGTSQGVLDGHQTAQLRALDRSPSVPQSSKGQSATLEKPVIQWCTDHKDDSPPPEDDEKKEKRTDDIPVWDQEFLKVDQGTLFELILAANYLDIKGLLDVTCRTVANMIKGQTPEELRKPFNIKNDFTEEEEAQRTTDKNLHLIEPIGVT